MCVLCVCVCVCVCARARECILTKILPSVLYRFFGENLNNGLPCQFFRGKEGGEKRGTSIIRSFVVVFCFCFVFRFDSKSFLLHTIASETNRLGLRSRTAIRQPLDLNC